MCDKNHYNKDTYKVLFYTLRNGKAPVVEFIRSLDKTIQAKIMKTLNSLENENNVFREPLTKKLEDKIYELRFFKNKSCVRILYFFYRNKTIVLTNGFVKKGNKTPKNEIVRAMKRRKEWIEENE